MANKRKRKTANPDGPALGPWIIPAPDPDNTGLPTTQDTGRLLERAAGKTGGDMQAAIDMYTDLFVRYTDRLIADHGALTLQAMGLMDVVDLRGILSYPEAALDPGSTVPDSPSPDAFLDVLSAPRTQAERFYALLPCFKAGLLRVNDRRWLRFDVRELDLDGLTAVIHVTDYMRGELCGADLVTMGRQATIRLEPPFDWDPVSLTLARELVLNGRRDPSDIVDVNACLGQRIVDQADFIRLYTVIPARKLGWTKRQARLWEAVTVQNAVNQQARFAEAGIDPELALANQFLWYVLLTNRYLDARRARVLPDHKATGPAHGPADRPPKPAAAPVDPDTPIRVTRDVGGIRFVSAQAPKKPSRRNIVRQYRLPSWPARGHVRHYKSGKTVYVKPTVKHRKALKDAPTPQVSATLKLKPIIDKEDTDNAQDPV